MEWQTVSEEHKPVKQQIEEIEKLLDEYENKIHLGTFRIKEVKPRLDISREELLAMAAEDIYGLCFEWGQYNIALQKDLNKHSARFEWAKNNLDKYLGGRAQEFSAFHFDERKMQALHSDSYAQSLYRLKEKSLLINDRTKFLTNQVKFLIEMAKNVADMKKWGEKK